MELHVLQLRNNVPEPLVGVHWLAFGPNTFNALVPFYANVNDTPAAYRDTSKQYTPREMYWLVHTLAAVGDQHYRQVQPLVEQCADDVLAATRAVQRQVDRECASHASADQLTAANNRLAEIATTKLTELLGKLVGVAFKNEHLQY